MKWLITRPPLFYIAGYLLAIFGFATGYTFMPNNFYQSTRYLEKYATANGQNNDELSSALLQDITNGIKKAFLDINNGDSIKVIDDSIFFHIDDLHAINVVSEANKVTFTITGVYYVNENPQYGSVILSTDLEDISHSDGKSIVWRNFSVEKSSDNILSQIMGIGILDGGTTTVIPGSGTGTITTGSGTGTITTGGPGATFNTGGGEASSETKAEGGNPNTTSTSNLTPTPTAKIRSFIQSKIPQEYKEKNIRSIFTDEIRKHKKRLHYLSLYEDTLIKGKYKPSSFIAVSENFSLNLKSFVLGLTNSPVENKGRWSLFFKMFYFSSITIATLGYGDIVPITPLARSLTAVEVILGVIIIGLFLNSLAQKIRVKSN